MIYKCSQLRDIFNCFTSPLFILNQEIVETSILDLNNITMRSGYNLILTLRKNSIDNFSSLVLVVITEIMNII